MPRTRFAWSLFDPVTVSALAAEIGWHAGDNGLDPVALLSKRAHRPNDDFVRRTKKVLEDTWLLGYDGTPQLVERLVERGVGPGGNPKTRAGCVDFVRKCRNSSSVRHHLLEALLRFGDADPATLDEDRLIPGATVRRFTVLRPADQPEDARQPYDYQVLAWQKLSAHLATARTTGDFRGLLVMPTGSGKTFTATRWLMREVVARGERVVWLAHRHELLEQAACDFYSCAALADHGKQLRVRLVSGTHCSARQIDPADDIIIASVGALVRQEDVVASLGDRPTLLVIDEAHHAPARTYQKVIRTLFGDSAPRLLGLTATPTRTVDCERGVLHDLFGGRVLHQVDTRDLILRGVLSRPIPVRVATRVDVEAGVTAEDVRHLAQFHELSEEWLGRIANLTERNRLILEHYLDHRQKYGKTLIFAINVQHAVLLTDLLEHAGVRVACIAHSGPVGGATTKEKLEAFRRPDGDIDVLVNVMILTEGVDVPCIETVFLARPTHSEILVRQMIGRGLRGPKSGGTENAYIVSFEDHWQKFRDWQSPLELIADLVAAVEPKSTPTDAERLLEQIPWEAIRATAAAMRDVTSDRMADCFEAVPQGWYVVEHAIDGDVVCKNIAVFEHQQDCWEQLLDALLCMSPAELDTAAASDVYAEWFDDCDDPAPAPFEVTEMVTHIQAGGGRPEFTPLPGRVECDPYALAEHIVNANLTEKERADLLRARHTPLARAMYPTMRAFQDAVHDAVYELHNPEEATRGRRAIPVFDSRPDVAMRPAPHHDLQALLAEVLGDAGRLLGLPAAPRCAATITWTRRRVKGWYAKAYFDKALPHGTGRIRVNSLLDSPDLSAETMRFLLWHEFLHLHLQDGHTPVFKELERRWPTSQGGDRELYNLNERFSVQYW